MKPVHYVICIIGSIAMAVWVSSGVTVRADVAVRLTLGALWGIVGIGWTLKLARIKSRG